MMYCLLCSYTPFDGEDDVAILKSVLSGHYSFPSPEWDDVSQHYRPTAIFNEQTQLLPP